jgi:hypothetical protein
MESDNQVPLTRYIRPKSILGSAPVTDRAKNSMLRKDESEKLSCVASIHVAFWDMSSDPDRSEYEKLMTRAANQRIEIKFISRHWSDEKSTVFVHVEWADYVIDKSKDN